MTVCACICNQVYLFPLISLCCRVPYILRSARAFFSPLGAHSARSQSLEACLHCGSNCDDDLTTREIERMRHKFPRPRIFAIINEDSRFARQNLHGIRSFNFLSSLWSRSFIRIFSAGEWAKERTSPLTRRQNALFRSLVRFLDSYLLLLFHLIPFYLFIFAVARSITSFRVSFFHRNVITCSKLKRSAQFTPHTSLIIPPAGRRCTSER